jgi:hypothetical protein
MVGSKAVHSAETMVVHLVDSMAVSKAFQWAVSMEHCSVDLKDDY